MSGSQRPSLLLSSSVHNCSISVCQAHTRSRDTAENGLTLLLPQEACSPEGVTDSSQLPAHWRLQKLVPQAITSSLREFVLQEYCSVGDRFVPCHPFPAYLSFHCQYKTILGFITKGLVQGRGMCGGGHTWSAMRCSCRGAVYAHCPKNSFLAG